MPPVDRLNPIRAGSSESSYSLILCGIFAGPVGRNRPLCKGGREAQRLSRNELHLIHAGTALRTVAWSTQGGFGRETHLNRLDQGIPEFIEVATRRKAARKLLDIGPVGAVVFFVDNCVKLHKGANKVYVACLVKLRLFPYRRIQALAVDLIVMASEV